MLTLYGVEWMAWIEFPSFDKVVRGIQGELGTFNGGVLLTR